MNRKLTKIATELVVIMRKTESETADGKEAQQKAVMEYLRSQNLTIPEINEIMMAIITAM